MFFLCVRIQLHVGANRVQPPTDGTTLQGHFNQQWSKKSPAELKVRWFFKQIGLLNYVARRYSVSNIFPKGVACNYLYDNALSTNTNLKNYAVKKHRALLLHSQKYTERRYKKNVVIPRKRLTEFKLRNRVTTRKNDGVENFLNKVNKKNENFFQ